MAYNLCLPSYIPVNRDGTAILVHQVIRYYAVLIQGLRHLEATAIQVMLASILVLTLAVYLSPSQLLIEPDLSASLGDRLPILMEGDLNAKHMDWNSRLIMTKVRLLYNYTSKNSCLI